MIFSSIPFLYYFLPVVLLMYFVVPRKGKNAVLLFASLVFYAWGELRYTLLMLLMITQGYVFGRLIDYKRRWSKIFLAASVVISLGVLGTAGHRYSSCSGNNSEQLGTTGTTRFRDGFPYPIRSPPPCSSDPRKRPISGRPSAGMV